MNIEDTKIFLDIIKKMGIVETTSTNGINNKYKAIYEKYVSTDQYDKYSPIKGLIPFLIGAIKELDKKISNLGNVQQKSELSNSLFLIPQSDNKQQQRIDEFQDNDQISKNGTNTTKEICYFGNISPREKQTKINKLDLINCVEKKNIKIDMNTSTFIDQNKIKYNSPNEMSPRNDILTSYIPSYPEQIKCKKKILLYVKISNDPVISIIKNMGFNIKFINLSLSTSSIELPFQNQMTGEYQIIITHKIEDNTTVTTSNIIPEIKVKEKNQNGIIIQYTCITSGIIIVDINIKSI